MGTQRPDGKSKLGETILETVTPSRQTTAVSKEVDHLRLTELELLSDQVAALGTADQVVAEILERLGIAVEVATAQLARIPKRGPLVLVTNEAFGSVEALVAYHILRQRREDVMVFGNLLLSGFARLHDAVVAIDPGFRLASRVRNVLSLKAALRFVQQGGAVGLLPTAETTVFDHGPWHVVDPTWNESIGQVIRDSGATVVPVRFFGNGDALLGLADLLQPTLGTLRPYTPNGHRSRVVVEIGQPVRSGVLSEFQHPEQIVTFLRDRADILQHRTSAGGPAERIVRLRPGVRSDGRLPTGHAPVAEPGHPELLAAEVESLPDAQKLVFNRGNLVAYARGRQCPHLLDEIGRLRQIAFRAVGEGTAEPRDLDRFDEQYDHLFVWNDRREVVGAYRLGRLDRLATGDVPYSGTLFEYESGFFEALGPALEMGRSFVRPEYQRSPVGLILLWKGIAQYLQRNPRYRYLLGPASISADYLPATRQLLVRYLETHYSDGAWSAYVRPRDPFDPNGARHSLWARYGRWWSSVADANRWIANLEPDDKAMPVLIKNYLQLGAQVLGFNVDRAFGGCVDGLVLVDLTKTPVATLKQFMGPDGAKRFLAQHGCDV